DGSADAVPSGGCPPYTYLWSNGQTTATATGLSADTYSVTVTDAGGSSVSTNVGLVGPEPLVFGTPLLSSYIGGINVSCKGESDGSIAITLSGGADCEDYLVDWSGSGGFSASGLEIDGLMAGTYTVNARDANGCSVETSITLTEPDALALLVSDVTSVSCHG